MDEEFKAWMREVDREISAVCGLSNRDLPDEPYRDYFNDGMSASETAHTVLDNNGFPF